MKTGAEGVFVAAVSAQGLGVALKIDDGAVRASETVIAAVLTGTGVVVDDSFAIAALSSGPIVNSTGQRVGGRRVSSWLQRELRRLKFDHTPNVSR